jgi:hypothetical protein
MVNDQTPRTHSMLQEKDKNSRKQFTNWFLVTNITVLVVVIILTVIHLLDHQLISSI